MTVKAHCYNSQFRLVTVITVRVTVITVSAHCYNSQFRQTVNLTVTTVKLTVITVKYSLSVITVNPYVK